MDILLLLSYSIVFLALIVLFVFALKKQTRRGWGLLFAFSGIASAAAAVIARIYDQLPGYGKAPGLTYLAEVLFSMFAAAVFAFIFALAILCLLIIKIRGRHR
ncbi:MAG: hypothetical protein IJ302_08585 [Clostridia bacterium]|nr:hypothetical protein [Clostridia bacterium]